MLVDWQMQILSTFALPIHPISSAPHPVLPCMQGMLQLRRHKEWNKNLTSNNAQPGSLPSLDIYAS